MAFLVAARREFPEVFVTETHPKILYYALCREPYDYQGSNKTLMNTRLGRWLGVDVAPRNSHEWGCCHLGTRSRPWAGRIVVE